MAVQGLGPTLLALNMVGGYHVQRKVGKNLETGKGKVNQSSLVPLPDILILAQ